MDYDFTKLDAVIDGCLNEFGSMGSKRLVRISKALQKKARRGNVNTGALWQNQSKALYKAKSSTARMIKAKGGTPSFDPMKTQQKGLDRYDMPKDLPNRKRASVTT
jgi:hypothetical protein